MWSVFFGFLRRRLSLSARYSLNGLRACFKNEEAFRVEIYIVLLLLPCAWFIANTKLELIILVVTLFLVLIAELFNSAIENIVDRVSTEKHQLSERSKDQASAAVLLSIVICVFTWLLIGFNYVL